MISGQSSITMGLDINKEVNKEGRPPKLHIKVNIMRSQSQALDDAQPGPVQQFDNKLMNSGHRTNDPLRLIPSQDNGNLDLCGRRSALVFSFSGCLSTCYRERPVHSRLDSV